MSNDSTYFAAKPPEECAGILLAKADNWFNNLESNGFLEKLRSMYVAYYGAYDSDVSDGHKITFQGDQGELTKLNVNHFRNLAQHLLVMITSSRPSLEARATNTDYKSLVQTRLANGLLDYYMREKRLEKYLKTAVECSIVLGAGYIKMEWNSMTGEIIEYNEDTRTNIYNGDVQFTNLSPLDVVFDNTKEDSNHDWVECRTFKNRFDLIAKYPEFEEQILGLPSKADYQNFSLNTMTRDQTDHIAVYEFYHNRTESMPDGRYMLFLSRDIVLADAPMPYRSLPVYRIAPSDILGTPYGYSPMFDILPIQEAINSIYSGILSNNTAFMVQNLYVPRNADISINSLFGGLNIIEGNAKPEPLQLTATAKETYDFLQILERVQETLSGVNAVARGNPPTSLESGNALALVQSMALQFVSGLQQSYVALMEDVGTGLINILKDFAAVPRVAAIVGKSNRTYMKEFKGDDLMNVNRVIVDVGNALARCLAKDTPVLMYDGSVKMVQDIRIDDLVMGPDSGPRTVTNVNSGTEMMYEVTSKDKNRNIKYGCNESHILTLKYCSDDYRYDAQKGDIIDISIRDYLKLPNRQKRLLQGFTTGVEFSKKDIPVPAYILGAWLGDGHSQTTALTSMDVELVNEWNSYADSIGMKVRVQENRQPNKSKVYFITSGQQNGSSDRNIMMNHLRELELINNKHIPSIYLHSSRNDRLNLLAGLIDTDGSRIDETFIFTQKSERLTNDVVYLAKSLGFRVTCKKFKANSSKLVGEIDSEAFKVTIGGNTHEIPTRLPRKQAREKDKACNWLNYGIEVSAVGEGTYYGFTLAEDPHFLLGDFTVTHNTTAGRVQMAEQLLQMSVLTSPEQYFQILDTGKLEVLTEGVNAQLLLIKAENEKMISGEQVQALAIDKHLLHINEHRDVLSDPDLRNDPELVANTLMHIQEHINMMRSVDPALLQIIGEQPLGPAPGTAPSIEQQPMPEDAAQTDMGQPSAQSVSASPEAAGVNQPQLPKPPAPFNNQPAGPNTGLPPQG